MPGLAGPETMVFKKARKMPEGHTILANGIVFNDARSSYTSPVSAVCRWYDMYTFLVHAVCTGQPTNIRITPEMSWNGTTWYPLHQQPSEIIEFEDTEVLEEMDRVGEFRKCYDGLVPGWFIRARIDAYGVDVTDTFTVSVAVWFRS